MSSITFHQRTINECLQQRFIFPTYQRDYKWELKHLEELLNDLQQSFLSNYKEGHGRTEVANYSHYFLGTIVTTENTDGRKTLIDGQQRITTLIIILIYFLRIKKNQDNNLPQHLRISDFNNLIKTELYGNTEYPIALEDNRKKLFDTLVNTEIEFDDIEQRIDIGTLDEGSKKIYNIFCSIPGYLNNQITDNELLPNFIDYFTRKVLLFEIVVPNEQDAHKVFVTMNDRGLNLSPIDLLKGYLLSCIQDNQVNKDCHQKWVEYINKLKSFGLDEDTSFLKTWLRSKYALTIRGKNRGDEPGDFDIIGDSYHRWVIDNKEKLGLFSTDNFKELVSNIIPKYVDIYLKIKDAESQLNNNYPHVYYNGASGLTLQAMAILSAIKYEDSNEDIDKKIKGISYYLDYWATVRFVNNKGNKYDTIRDNIFTLINQIRDQSVVDIKTILINNVASMPEKIESLKTLSYVSSKRQPELLQILARIAEFLENETEQTNRVGFCAYINRYENNKTFDIEHILTSSIEVVRQELGDKWDFVSDNEFTTVRNNIGGLILLQRGRNRSLKDKSFSEKLSVYSTENILAKTLDKSFYSNNPSWDRFEAKRKFNSTEMEYFNKMSIQTRLEFYFKVSTYIWNAEHIKTLMS